MEDPNWDVFACGDAKMCLVFSMSGGYVLGLERCRGLTRTSMFLLLYHIRIYDETVKPTAQTRIDR